MGSRCDSCIVRDRALCAALDPAALQALGRIGVVRRLGRGETLSWAGDDAPTCATLQSGVMKLVVVTSDGEQAIVGMLFPGDFIGRPFGGVQQQDIVALTDVQICAFPRAAFAATLRDHQAMQELLLARTMAELDRARDWLVRMGHARAGERVAGFLEDVARRLGALGCEGPSAVVELPLGRGEMAELLGLTIETVSRQISRLKTIGAISLQGTRRLIVEDPALLARAAGR
ncbi:MAG: Crp/Fnr family transcriptional regulator [Polymorphobacter sp.]|uniref:Crp/Fnr family transcriptional regulator n=1 Tax=Polymorphobacter sp. TaxID=1909290 RepID=UPI003A8B07A9